MDVEPGTTGLLDLITRLILFVTEGHRKGNPERKNAECLKLELKAEHVKCKVTSEIEKAC